MLCLLYLVDFSDSSPHATTAELLAANMMVYLLSSCNGINSAIKQRDLNSHHIDFESNIPLVELMRLCLQVCCYFLCPQISSLLRFFLVIPAESLKSKMSICCNFKDHTFQDRSIGIDQCWIDNPNFVSSNPTGDHFFVDVIFVDTE